MGLAAWGWRQKVKTYFLPVQSAKKGRQSLPFFGVKARKPTTLCTIS
jgi:hypothetical protein